MEPEIGAERQGHGTILLKYDGEVQIGG